MGEFERPQPPEEEKTKPTPEWVRLVYPTVKETLPENIIDEMNSIYAQTVEKILQEYKQKGFPESVDIVTAARHTTHFYIGFFANKVSDWLERIDKNLLARLRPAIQELPKGLEEFASGKMKQQTFGEFIDEVTRSIEKTGLRARDIAAQKASFETSIQLLPAFIDLLEKGYSRVPDFIRDTQQLKK